MRMFSSPVSNFALASNTRYKEARAHLEYERINKSRKLLHSE